MLPPAENTNPHTAVLRPDDRYTIAALNYNGARVPFSPFSEEVDGKLGSVYTAVTETLVARGDWRRLPAVRNRETDELKLAKETAARANATISAFRSSLTS